MLVMGIKGCDSQHRARTDEICSIKLERRGDSQYIINWDEKMFFLQSGVV